MKPFHNFQSILYLVALLHSPIESTATRLGSGQASRKAVSTSNIENYYDVVIIGAGWAGIAAANTLFDQNVKNFTVLEARPYIGGRSVTSFAFGDDIPVDLGSGWVQGITNNPVQALVKKYGVKYSVVEDSEAVYFSNSTGLSDDLVGQLYDEYWDGNDGFMRYEEEKQSSTNTDQSLATTAADYVSEKNMNALQTREFDWLADTSIVEEYAADLSELSTWWWDNDLELGGGDAFLGVVGGGYSTVINSYASEILPYIQLNSIVTNVDYSLARVLVTYNKTGVLRTISASKVIITLPLGVLKAGMEAKYLMT
jgi:monoamine oxidase